MRRRLVWLLGFLVAMPVVVFLLQIVRVDVWAALTPLQVQEVCSATAVEEYLAKEPLSEFFGQIEHPRSDVGRLKEARASLAKRTAVPCLMDIRDEEVAMADTMIAGIENAQSDNIVQRLYGVWILAGVGRHTERLYKARTTLEQQYGQGTGAMGSSTDGAPPGNSRGTPPQSPRATGGSDG